jgi:hypothetical protein
MRSAPRRATAPLGRPQKEYQRTSSRVALRVSDTSEAEPMTTATAITKSRVANVAKTYGAKSTVSTEAARSRSTRTGETGALTPATMAPIEKIRRPCVTLPEVQSHRHDKYQQLVDRCAQLGPIPLTFMSGADAAGIVLGARIPIILTSRADNLRTRLASAAVAVLIAHTRCQAVPKAIAAE